MGWGWGGEERGMVNGEGGEGVEKVQKKGGGAREGIQAGGWGGEGAGVARVRGNSPGTTGGVCAGKSFRPYDALLYARESRGR